MFGAFSQISGAQVLALEKLKKKSEPIHKKFMIHWKKL